MAEFRGFGLDYHLVNVLERHFAHCLAGEDGELEIEMFEGAVDDIVAMLRDRNYLAKED